MRAEHDQFSEKYMDLTELLGIAGVPTFLFIHPEGQWKHLNNNHFFSQVESCLMLQIFILENLHCCTLSNNISCAGYISWHGRYSSFDYSSFSAFLRHTNSEVIQHPCPVFNCDCCKNDMSIDEDLICKLLQSMFFMFNYLQPIKKSKDSCMQKRKW